METGPSKMECPTRHFLCLRAVCTKTEVMGISRLWYLNDKKVEDLLHLLVSRVLEVHEV